MEAVGVLQPDETVGPLTALRRAIERQILGLALQVRDLRDPELVGLALQHAERVRVGERRRREGGFALRLELRLGLGIGLLGIGGNRLRAEDRLEQRRGVLRVAADLTLLERLVRDHLGAEVQVGADVVARRLQRLGVDVPEDVLLGEVLRTHGQRDVLVRRVRLDQVGGVAPVRPGVVVVAAAPTGGNAECDDQRRKQHESRPKSRMAGHHVTLLSFRGSRAPGMDCVILCRRTRPRQLQAPRCEQPLQTGEAELERQGEQRDQDRACDHALVAVDVAAQDEIAERAHPGEGGQGDRGDDVDGGRFAPRP